MSKEEPKIKLVELLNIGSEGIIRITDKGDYKVQTNSTRHSISYKKTVRKQPSCIDHLGQKNSARSGTSTCPSYPHSLHSKSQDMSTLGTIF